MAHEYYNILGISPTASDDEIKRAYRKKAMEHHPDRHGGDKGKEAEFKKINEAYATLSDVQKRAHYDRFGTAGNSSGFGGFEGGFQDFDISDIFSSFFNGGQASGGRSRREDGADIEVTVRISFADALSGTHRTVAYDRRTICGDCLGSGAEHGAKPRTCSTCGGQGRVRRRMQTLFGIVEQAVTCETCGGEGSIIDTKCRTCHGKKYTVKKIERAIDIPSGIESGMSMRIPGEGHEGLSGKHGDLYVAFEVPESFEGLSRQELDLHFTVTLDPIEMILGTRKSIIIPVIGEYTIDVPTGTQHGTVLHFRNEGVKHISQEVRGDLHITLMVIIPTRLSRTERELYEKIAVERGIKHKDTKGMLGKIFGE